MQAKFHFSRIVVTLCLLSLAAISLAWYTTSSGSGLGPDSYFYIATARSLLEGEGARLPQSSGAFVHSAHFPPFYAAMLAWGSLDLYDPVVTARWLNALLFGATLFLVGLSIHQLSGGSWMATLIGSVFFLCSDGLLHIHAQVWSEPLFYCLSTLGLLILSTYLSKPRPARLIGAAIAIALAFLTRYAGITLVATGILSLLLFTAGTHSEKLRRTALFTVMSILPVGLWLFYNLQEAGSLTDRVLGVHPVGFQDLSQGVNILTSWIFPGVPPNASLTILSVGIGLTGLVILIFYLIRSLRSQRSQAIREAPEPPAIPFAIYTLTYLVFVPLSISFFDAQTSLDWRILSPIYVTCLILVSVALARWAPRLPKPARWAGLIGILVVASAQVYSGIEMARLLTTGENKGYNSDFWKTSKLIQQVDGYPASTPIYSNGYDVIYLLTGRAATSIPKEFSPNSLRANPRFEEEMQAMQMELAESNGLLVVFFEMEERRRYLPSEYELNELLPLERITRWTEEGTLYRVIHQPDE